MFNKDPASMFNIIFNIPQGFFMTIILSAYQGIFDPGVVAVSFVKAYCAGVMLTTLLRLDAVGAWFSEKLHAGRNKLSGYLASTIPTGAIMGVLMNSILTFMAVGPAAGLFDAWRRCLGISVAASVVISCLFCFPVTKLVRSRFPEE